MLKLNNVLIVIPKVIDFRKKKKGGKKEIKD